jgi:hypothetical protein
MQFWKITLALGVLFVATTAPNVAQEQTSRSLRLASPEGTFVDKYGTSFVFSLCGKHARTYAAFLVTYRADPVPRRTCSTLVVRSCKLPQ